MKSISIKAMLVSLALVAAGLALAGTARASHVEAEIVVPGQIQVGQPVEVQTTLRNVEAGLPVAGIPVVFYTDAAFGEVSGVVELGRGITNEIGVAALEYEPRLAGVHEIRVEYQLPGEAEVESLSTAISVSGGSQLHRSTAGLDIPGLNVWILIALVSIVWAILLFGVALRVVAIARDGDDGSSPASQAIGG
jgi:hypothetical protein